MASCRFVSGFCRARPRTKVFLTVYPGQRGNAAALSPFRFLMKVLTPLQVQFKDRKKSQVELMSDFSWIPASALPCSARVLFCCLTPQCDSGTAAKPALRLWLAAAPLSGTCSGTLFSALKPFISHSFWGNSPQKGISVDVNGNCSYSSNFVSGGSWSTEWLVDVRAAL